MHQRPRLLGLILPALLVSGCGGTHNRGLESVHQPVVSRSDFVFDLATEGGRLPAVEAGRLAGWMASLGVRYGDRIAVDDPARTGAIADVAAEVARHGLMLDPVAPPTAGPVPSGSLRVVVSRMVATVPGCPDHSREYEPNFGAHTSSDYGCAVNSNLAAMVAQPEDLVRGRSGVGTADLATAGKAIQSYRERAPGGGTGESGGGTAAVAAPAPGGAK